VLRCGYGPCFFVWVAIGEAPSGSSENGFAELAHQSQIEHGSSAAAVSFA